MIQRYNNGHRRRVNLYPLDCRCELLCEWHTTGGSSATGVWRGGRQKVRGNVMKDVEGILREKSIPEPLAQTALEKPQRAGYTVNHLRSPAKPRTEFTAVHCI